jgi:hypothetical protein
MTQTFPDPLPREEQKSLPVSLRFCGRLFSEPELELMCVVAQDYSGLAVTEIARTVCELLEWKRPNSRLKDHECRQLLERLAAEGVLRLPALRPPGGRGPRRVDLSPLRWEPEAVECAARECEPLELVLVEGPAESRLWREYVERYHYLGSRVPFGSNLRNWVRNRQRELACLLWTSPAWKMKPRDLWIGWCDEQRQRHLQGIVNNGRFLILPGSTSADWRARFWRSLRGNFQRTGKVTTAIVRCCWKPSWMPAVFVEPAIERPTGSMWDRPPGAVAWIGSTRLTAKPSKTSTSILWSVTPSSAYAAGPFGKQIRCGGWRHQFSEAEVKHFEEATLVNNDVGGFEIAVNQTGVVRVSESLSNLYGVPYCQIHC